MVILSEKDSSINVRKLSTDPGRAYRHVPIIEVGDIFDAMPQDCTPVAVEITDNAKDLTTFAHPERDHRGHDVSQRDYHSAPPEPPIKP